MLSKFIPKKVNVVLSIPPEEVEKNIKTNINQIPSWFGEMFYPNGYEAIIISAGPSMEKYVEELNLKERMGQPNRSFIVFCVKHALPRLQKMGIEPDFCVILDGRDFNGTSTHGEHRKELFKEIPEKTIFMVASMSHPGYANYLMINGARVLGWHTMVDGIMKFREAGIIKEPIISGGTSSGTRCISIANALGMKDITLLGFDSCIHSPSKEQLKEKDGKGRPKYIPVDLPVTQPELNDTQKELVDVLEKEFSTNEYIYKGNIEKRFWTTGELLAQAHDFEAILGNPAFDMKFRVLDDGLVGHMFNNMDIPKRSYSFIEYFRRVCPRKNLKGFPRRNVVLGEKKRPNRVETQSFNAFNMMEPQSLKETT